MVKLSDLSKKYSNQVITNNNLLMEDVPLYKKLTLQQMYNIMNKYKNRQKNIKG